MESSLIVCLLDTSCGSTIGKLRGRDDDELAEEAGQWTSKTKNGQVKGVVS